MGTFNNDTVKEYLEESRWKSHVEAEALQRSAPGVTATPSRSAAKVTFESLFFF